jgi:hypothetical protein
MAILTDVGRAALAQAIQNNALHLAWGTGDPDWDETPLPPLLADTDLVAEVGRAALHSSGYAIPDDDGLVETPTGRFTLVAGPTQHLYLRFDFGFADAADQVIREVGLFLGSTIEPGLPEGQRYFVPAEVTDPGLLLAVERFETPLVRSPLNRQQFEFVLTI